MSRQVVDLPLAESIRHHLDLQKDNQNARFVQKALKMYTSLANRAVRAGCAVDIFACSLDQVSRSCSFSRQLRLVACRYADTADTLTLAFRAVGRRMFEQYNIYIFFCVIYVSRVRLGSTR